MKRFEEKGGTLILAIVGTAVVAFGCVEGTVSNDAPPGPYCRIYISRTKGMVHKHFSARITYSSNYVRDPEYGYRGTLPPGLSLDADTGSIAGIPTLAGFWNVRLYVRDRNRGTHDEKPGEKWWYYLDTELAMYDKLEEPDR
jgi:hypothetical protein